MSRRADRIAAGWCITLVLPALVMWGCGAGGPQAPPGRQDELRTRYQIAPRVPLSLMQLAARAAADDAGVDGACDLAGGLVLARQYAEAADVYRKLLPLHPDAPRIHYGLGHVLARTGRYEEAIGHWRRTVELVPDFADAFFDLGVAHAQRAPTAVDQPANLSYADLDLSIDYCRRAVELEPGNAIFQQNLGRALQLRHRSEEAAVAYQAALAIDDGLIDAHRYLAEILLAQDRLVEALTACQAVVRLDSTDATGHYQLGKTLERSLQYEGALAAYEAAVDLQPQYRGAWYSLAQLYPQLGRAEAGKRALARFESLAEETELQIARRRVQRLPNGVVQRRGLAVTYAEAGQYGNAVEEFHVALALADQDPERATIYHDLGLVYDRLGDSRRALASLREAAEAAPDTARFQLRLGQALAKVGRDSLAIAAVKQALVVAPGWPRAQYELAMLYLKNRQTAPAQSLFEAVLEAEPDHVDARFGLGLTCIDQRRFTEAVTHLEAVISRQPDYPRVQQVLATVRRQSAAGQ